MVRFRDAVACLLISSAVCGGFAFYLGRLTALEVRACKCEESVIVRGKPYPCDPCEKKR